jgi:hypothetical protein
VSSTLPRLVDIFYIVDAVKEGRSDGSRCTPDSFHEMNSKLVKPSILCALVVCSTTLSSFRPSHGKGPAKML